MDCEPILLGLLGTEMANGSMVREQISSPQELCDEVNVPLILPKSKVVQLYSIVSNFQMLKEIKRRILNLPQMDAE